MPQKWCGSFFQLSTTFFTAFNGRSTCELLPPSIATRPGRGSGWSDAASAASGPLGLGEQEAYNASSLPREVDRSLILFGPRDPVVHMGWATLGLFNLSSLRVRRTEAAFHLTTCIVQGNEVEVQALEHALLLGAFFGYSKRCPKSERRSDEALRLDGCSVDFHGSFVIVMGDQATR